MKLCLQHFPPSRGFENYFEIWLRNKDPSPENVMRRLLHEIVYNGPASSPPSVDEIQANI